MKYFKPLKILLAACLCVSSASAQAGVIISPKILVPDGVIINSMGELGTAGVIEAVMNQSGLSSTFTSGVTDFASFNATHTQENKLTANRWNSATNNVTGNIVFDLGQAYQLEQLALWQGLSIPQKAVGSNVTSFKLYTTNLLTTAKDVNSLNWLDVSTGGNAYTAAVGTGNKQTFDLIDSTAQYVRLNVLANNGNTVTTLGEIAFDVTAAPVSAVPEPSTYAMLLVGLGLLGWAKRRQHS